MVLFDNWSSSVSLIGRDECRLVRATAVISCLQSACRLSLIFPETRYPLFGTMLAAESLGCRAIGEDQGIVPTHAGCRDRSIAIAQTHQRLGFLAPRHQPQDPPRPVDDRKRQCHPAPSQVGT